MIETSTHGHLVPQICTTTPKVVGVANSGAAKPMSRPNSILRSIPNRLATTAESQPRTSEPRAKAPASPPCSRRALPHRALSLTRRQNHPRLAEPLCEGQGQRPVASSLSPQHRGSSLVSPPCAATPPSPSGRLAEPLCRVSRSKAGHFVAPSAPL